jgi:hypothetical protein
MAFQSAPCPCSPIQQDEWYNQCWQAIQDVEGDHLELPEVVFITKVTSTDVVHSYDTSHGGRKQMPRYERGTNFPNEGFVQASIEAHFEERGFTRIDRLHVDLVCEHPETGEQWIIESKGQTTAIGLDLRTGPGQLLYSMDNPAANYGLAVPDIEQLRNQLLKVPSRVRVALGIHWLLVAETGAVSFVDPLRN